MATLAAALPAPTRGGPFGLLARIAERTLRPSLHPARPADRHRRRSSSSPGRTKVEGLFTVPQTTFDLFETEYALPLLDPHTAAYAAAAAEHVFPILLFLGLFTRCSALALLGMTAVIQIFVYPDAWPTHLSWAAVFLPLIAFGGGRFSLDRLLRIP